MVGCASRVFVFGIRPSHKREYDPVAIESHLRLVLVSWSVIIAAAWICGRLGKRIGQPLAVGEIAAGLLLEPSAIGALWPEGMALVFPSETQPEVASK